MGQKECTVCKEVKPLEAFSQRTGKCKPCQVIRNREYRARKRTALTDASAHTYGKEPLPPGYTLKGVSQYVDAEGNVKGQWLKSTVDKDKDTELVMTALRDMAEEYRGIVEPVDSSDAMRDSDLLTVIPLGDPHIGLHCWGEETGSDDFDLKIAESNLQIAVADLFKVAPPAKRCLLINLGDFTHSDNSKNTTTRGTPVDVDGRRTKIIRTCLSIFRSMIDHALLTHEQVHVICAIGNHDGESSQMLAVMLDLMYEREPRVHIETSPRKFHKYHFGKCLIAVTHGDTAKVTDLPLLMAVDWKVEWSSTEYRQWYTGHIHHDTVKEFPGCIVETFRTLAPRDSWHSHQGYRSGRDLKLDVWHREWGHVQRHVIGIRRIKSLKGEDDT